MTQSDWGFNKGVTCTHLSPEESNGSPTTEPVDHFKRIVVLRAELRVCEDYHRYKKRQYDIGDGESRDTRLGIGPSIYL